MKANKIFPIFLLFISGVAMSDSKIIKRISFYDEVENKKEAEVLKSIFRIISTESDTESEKKYIGEFSLHYPKNPRHPVVTAFADPDNLNMRFDRVTEKSAWERCGYYPSGRKSNLYQAHLPNFAKSFFLSENMKFISIKKEEVKNIDHQINKNSPEWKIIHIFNYSYKAKTGIPLDVQFHVDDELFKNDDTYPKHFYFVRVTARKN